MDKLFRLPQPASSNAQIFGPAPDDARERDDAIVSAAMATPTAVERDEQQLRAARDFAARTKTIRRAGYGRGVRWALGAAVMTLAFGPAGGVAAVAMAELMKGGESWGH